MSFETRLADSQHLIETHLDALLGSLGPEVPVRLLEAMRHGVLGGGKRFRPFLVIETAALLGRPPAEALDAAAAVELVHCYSLIHDDLPAMDNDDLRRGAPTVHRAFDEATAILAGDTLLTMAFEILARPVLIADPAVRAELILVLAKAAGGTGMAGGQTHDLAAEGRYGPDGAYVAPKDRQPRQLAQRDIETLQAMKTGALIRAAVEMGAIVGGADPAERQALADYATALGLAFQISDDLLDAEGETEVIGKKAAKDGAAGKATLVGLLGPTEARRRLEAAVAESLAALAPLGGPADALAEAARFMASRRS
ncbi:MAG: polyprenyl synthetase family protein [Hyphomicrobiaceae bacterium]